MLWHRAQNPNSFILYSRQRQHSIVVGSHFSRICQNEAEEEKKKINIWFYGDRTIKEAMNLFKIFKDKGKRPAENQCDVHLEKQKGKKKGKVEAESVVPSHNQNEEVHGDNRITRYGGNTNAKIQERLNEEQKAVLSYVVLRSLNPNHLEILFEWTKVRLYRINLMSMDYDPDPEIMTALTIHLNRLEENKSKLKPAKLSARVFQEEDDKQKVEYMVGLNKAVNVVRGRKLKQIELILIPVRDSDRHYYVMIFSLKLSAVEILDIVTSEETVEKSMEKLQTSWTIVVTFLSTNSLRKKAKSITEATITKVQIPWIESSEKAYSGLFVMRHLEAYMGVATEEWECNELKQKSMKGCVDILKKNYMHALLTSPMNAMNKTVMMEVKKHMKVAKK